MCHRRGPTFGLFGLVPGITGAALSSYTEIFENMLPYAAFCFLAASAMSFFAWAICKARLFRGGGA